MLSSFRIWALLGAENREQVGIKSGIPDECFWLVVDHSECFPGSSVGEESTCNVRDSGLIPGSGRSPGEGIGYPHQMAQMVKNLPAVWETWFDSWVRKIPWRRDRLSTSVFLGFPDGSDGKESACNAGDLVWYLGQEGHRGGNGNPLQYSCLEDPHGQRSPVATVHGVTKRQTQLSD